LLCPQCNTFFAGDRGLRTHQQMRHGKQYSTALSAVHAAKRQMIVCPPLHGPVQEARASESAPPQHTPSTMRHCPEQHAAAYPRVPGPCHAPMLIFDPIPDSSVPSFRSNPPESTCLLTCLLRDNTQYGGLGCENHAACNQHTTLLCSTMSHAPDPPCHFFPALQVNCCTFPG
jgi:hypothetical protein